MPYHFVADHHPPWPHRTYVPHHLHRAVLDCCARALARGEQPVVHVNGLLFPLATRLLTARLSRAARARHRVPVVARHRIPVVAQHHAEPPWRGRGAVLQRWGLAPVDGFFFASRELAHEWVACGTIRSIDRVHEVMEASSPFHFEERAAARACTGLIGDPVILWTGNLNANKDPLTILSGFERLLERFPRARLYMAYRYADLLPRVEARIGASESLRSTVALLGEIAYAGIEAYYNSADFFVQGSAREGSGLALLDAMACGVVPVVTDIPSFRTLTDGGRVGAIWRRGDPDAFVSAFFQAASRPLDLASQQTRGYFETTWSPPALGRRAVAAYRDVLRAGAR
ncbi:MAG TPA: glycosyltransferase family 4 protein [Anaerolineae bacterium]|nr:glycosyltransferase family 4 protein [Anaerolineae bacterium]